MLYYLCKKKKNPLGNYLYAYCFKCNNAVIIMLQFYNNDL